MTLPRKQLRAVTFHVQPVLVADDGDSLTPVEINPITVTASDWPTFAVNKWPELLGDLQAQLNAQNQPGEQPSA